LQRQRGVTRAFAVEIALAEGAASPSSRRFDGRAAGDPWHPLRAMDTQKMLQF